MSRLGGGLPRWASLPLAAALPPKARDAHLGDLEERHRLLVAREGPGAARRWLAGQVLRSMGPALAMRWRARHDDEPNRRGMTMDRIRTDLRFAFRSLRKSPAFALLAVGTLGMAMAVNTAIFSLVTGIFMADLPIEDPERMAFVWGVDTRNPGALNPVTPADYLDLTADLGGAAGVGAMEQATWVLTGRGDPERVAGARVSPDFLDVWGVQPFLGRDFGPGDVGPGASAVVLVSHGFWTRTLGRDPDVLGGSLTLDGRPHTIVGVVPRDMEFGGLAGMDVWAPLELEPATASRTAHTLMVSVRLAPGATLEQLRAEIQTRWTTVASAHPAETRDWSVQTRSTKDSLLNDSARAVMALLGIVVALVLLIACANVANLLLARGARRAPELAVRSVLGAGRGGLIRQLLLESVLLSVAATALGLFASERIVEFLQYLTADSGDNVFYMARIDGRVLAFSGLLALGAPVVFGLLPALRASRADFGRDLQWARGGAGGPGRVRSVLVGAQVALAVVNLVVGGLLVRSVVELQALDADYRRDGIVTAAFLRPVAAGSDDDFFDRVVERVRGIPGVQAAGLVSELPRWGAPTQLLEVEGQASMEEVRRVMVTTATPGYLDVVEVSVLRGRDFRVTDGAASQPVAVVSRATAERYWPEGGAVGGRIRLGGVDEPWVEIVGVVADVKRNAQTGAPLDHVYRPLAQRPGTTALTLVAAVPGAPDDYGDAVRAAVRDLDPLQPVADLMSLRQAEFRTNSTGYALISLFVFFAVFALVMAGAGIYGVISYSVAGRTPEFGVRLALGAPPGRVRRMVMTEGLVVVVVGVAVGLVGAWFAGGLAGGMLVGVAPRDPLTFVVVTTLLVGVAAAANWIPAVRATRVDPVEALRRE